MLRARAVPFAVLVALTAAACGGGEGRTAASSSQTPSALPAATATSGGTIAPVPEVLDFTAQRLGGGTIEGALYAGAPLAIWFWAPW